jgi:hypothetical protein
VTEQETNKAAVTGWKGKVEDETNIQEYTAFGVKKKDSN